MWKNIKVEGYEDLYMVNENGNVLSLNYRNLGISKEVKTKTDKKGYIHIRLHKDTTQKQIGIHRVVALTFLEKPSFKCEVNHKDGIKSNNNVENLEWITRSENIKHAFKLGLRQRLIGELNPNYKHGNNIVKCND